MAECGGVRARWSLAGTGGKRCPEELEQGGLPGSPGSLRGALSKVLKGQLLSGMMGEPVPSSSPQGLFGGARTPCSATFIDHVTFHKSGKYKLGSGYSKKGWTRAENSSKHHPLFQGSQI